MLLRETWGVAEEVVAEVSAPAPNPPKGGICTAGYSPESCWMEQVDAPGCYVWNPSSRENVTVTWSRGCSNGLAEGNGRLLWYQNDELIQIWQTGLERVVQRLDSLAATDISSCCSPGILPIAIAATSSRSPCVLYNITHSQGSRQRDFIHGLPERL